jgi:hypothetical protein
VRVLPDENGISSSRSRDSSCPRGRCDDRKCPNHVPVLQYVERGPRFSSKSAAGLQWTVPAAMVAVVHADPEEWVLHSNPAWREKANFIVNAHIPENETNRKYEQLWARQLAPHLFEICCIPFFIYDLALGDFVRTDANYMLHSVEERSGRYTFRAWFGPAANLDDVALQVLLDLITTEIRQLNGSVEQWSRNLIAISVANDEIAKIMAAFLCRKQQEGVLIYERGHQP